MPTGLSSDVLNGTIEHPASRLRLEDKKHELWNEATVEHWQQGWLMRGFWETHMLAMIDKVWWIQRSIAPLTRHIIDCGWVGYVQDTDKDMNNIIIDEDKCIWWMRVWVHIRARWEYQCHNSHIKLNFKASLFSCIFWFEDSLLCKNAFEKNGLC